MAAAVAMAMQAAHNSTFTQLAASEQTRQPQSDVKRQAEGQTPPTQEKSSPKKSKRVRSGCLTCRDRHLKCDEGQPVCQNCLKSNRECKRGLRINWQELKCERVPYAMPRTADWAVSFQDESRDIAAEYTDGVEKYPPLQNFRSSEPRGYQDHYNYQHRPSYPNIGSDHSGISNYERLKSALNPNQQHQLHNPSPPNAMSTQSQVDVFLAPHQEGHYTPSGPDQDLREPEEPDYLVDQKEVLFMQVFVEEVGLWMDSMDSKKHFSRLLPFHSLKEPMLRNAFLACGARHLALVNPRYSEDEALNYYDQATKHLLDALQDPNRDTVLCATTAVILNVYEIMCERTMQRMNHIAGARALIKECGWSARSNGIGAACFWLNVGMELLSCLHFNWQVAWEPDEWGVDMNLTPESESGREEFWTQRMVYIVAKVCNFRASIPRDGSHVHQNLHAPHAEWASLKDLAETWNRCVPRTMHPLGFLYPGQTLSGSAFPEVYLLKRTSIVARLFFHTCMCLLAQINPIAGPDEPKMRQMLEEHAQQICGICAHVKDRGVASVALRSLAIAAEVLTERKAQEEVLAIIAKIRQETGWRVGFINDELQAKWGWKAQNQQAQQPQQQHVQQQAPLPPQPQSQPRPPMRFPNPLQGVDFNNAQHPYQEVYVAPNINMMQQIQHPSSTQHPHHQHHPSHDNYSFY